MGSVPEGSPSSGYGRPRTPQNGEGKHSVGKTHRRHDSSQQGHAQTTATMGAAASTISIEIIIRNHLQCREG